MRAVEVIVMKVGGKKGSAMIAGAISAGVRPFASDGLDKAFGFTIGLRSVRFGEGVFEAELLTSMGEEFRAISGTAIGEHPLDGDTPGIVEVDGLVESSQSAGDLFIGMKRGESQSTMIIDGDVETFDAGAWIADGAIAGGAHSGAREAAQLLDVEVEQLAGKIAFVAQRRSFGRLQSAEAMEAVATQNAGDSGHREIGQEETDLGVRAVMAAQFENALLDGRRGFARLTARS